MKETIIEILNETERYRRENGIDQTYTTIVELQIAVNERMRKTLNEMYANGEIVVGDVVKTKYIQLKK